MYEFLQRAREEAAIATIDVDGAYSYERLFRVVSALNAEIDRRGRLLPGIAVYGSHGLALYAAIIAGLQRGGRIVFLDPATELSAVGSILEALGVSLILDGSKITPAAPPGLEIIEVRTGVADAPGHLLEPAVSCRDYAILTSGTTGEPKVILQSIENLRAHIANYAGYVGVRPGDRVLQLASAGWDAGLMDIFACLFHGGVLCSINPRAHDVGEVRRFIAEHTIDILHMTVPYYRLVHANPDVVYPAPIRLVLGGELIYARDLERFEQVAPVGSTLFNAYGPTECTTALYGMHRPGMARSAHTWPLAHRIAGIDVELNRDGELVRDTNVTGELVICSALLARRFDPTSRVAFDLDTTVLADGKRCYATGDLAHYDEDGRVVITGRKDSVIKVSGQKVSLHEVETVVRGVAGVADACVVARQDEGEVAVIAAIVPTDETVQMVALRRALAERLPGHKLPKQLLLLPALPLNKNNKIDRARILELAAEQQRTPVQNTAGDDLLTAEIRKALRGTPIDRSLSFIENGGDSLRALSVVAALKRRGHRLSLESLVSRTPIAELALGGPARAGAKPTPAGSSLPNRALLESWGIPDLDRWCQTAVFDHIGDRGASEVAEVLHAVLARHTARWPGQPPVVDIMAAQPLRDVVSEMEARISLQAGRLCVAGVVPGDRGLHLVVSCHQFHVDRMSWILLLSELADGTREGVDAIRRWPAPSPDMAGWIALYHQHRSTERATELWASLPWDRCAELVPATTSFPARDAFARASIDLGAFAGGSAAAGSQLQQINHALLAAVLMALAGHSGNRWQKLDLLEHGRDIALPGVDSHGIFGWFTVIHPLVLEVADEHAAVAGAVVAHLERVKPVVHTFGHERTGDRRHRCGASYNFLGDLEIAATAEYAVNPLAMETMHGAASHHIEFTGHVYQGRVRLMIDYDRQAFHPGAIDRIGAAIAGTFRGAGAPAPERMPHR